MDGTTPLLHSAREETDLKRNDAENSKKDHKAPQAAPQADPKHYRRLRIWVQRAAFHLVLSPSPDSDDIIRLLSELPNEESLEAINELLITVSNTIKIVPSGAKADWLDLLAQVHYRRFLITKHKRHLANAIRLGDQLSKDFPHNAFHHTPKGINRWRSLYKDLLDVVGFCSVILLLPLFRKLKLSRMNSPDLNRLVRSLARPNQGQASIDPATLRLLQAKPSIRSLRRSQ
jgi:hypothetical protein